MQEHISEQPTIRSEKYTLRGIAIFNQVCILDGMNRIPTPEELNMIEPEPEKASVLEATRFAIERHKARRNKMDRERDERNKAKGETK